MLKEDYYMSMEEAFVIAGGLDIYHSIFYSFWTNILPIFSYSVPTAAVGFSKEGKNLWMKINPDFWDSCSDYKKVFIIAHEILHIILAHGPRSSKLPRKHADIINIALDLCDNHILVDSFGFVRELIEGQEDLIWKDTIFKEDPKCLETFESYYRYLLKNEYNLKYPLDSHSELGSIGKISDHEDSESEEEISESNVIKDIIKNIQGSSSLEEINDFIGSLKEEGKSNPLGGVIGEPPIIGKLTEFVKLKSIPIKKKWEEVIRYWTSFILKEDKDYQWIHDDRRFAAMLSEEEICIPQLADTETKVYEKIDLLFFLDTSGSCDNLRDRFVRAALSLDPKKFNVRLFSRTTVAREIKVEQVMTMLTGGNDRFQCMEDLIQEELSSGKLKKYPKAIFHLTDGVDCASTIMTPKIPENWHFFLTNGGYKDRLPPKSNVYYLKDFE